MSPYTLSIATYPLGLHPLTSLPKSQHWSFLISTSPSPTAFQLHGMPGSFHYPGPENASISNPAMAAQSLEIGLVDGSKLDRVHEILEGVGIDPSESSGWNCQDWTLEGLERLREEGMVYEGMTREGVRGWLREG